MAARDSTEYFFRGRLCTRAKFRQRPILDWVPYAEPECYETLNGYVAIELAANKEIALISKPDAREG